MYTKALEIYEQDIANKALSDAIAANDPQATREAIDRGADVHAFKGYLLTRAQIYTKIFDRDSVACIVADAMFGENGFTLLMLTRDLGYTPTAITQTLRNSLLNSAQHLPDIDIPDNLSMDFTG